MAKNWAIAIGINQYDNLQSLKYAQRDAEVMKDWFERSAKFDKVFLFTENSPDIPTHPPISTKPTYGRLRRFFRAQFEKPLLLAGDNLWFFFAGHGKRYADRDYLMLSDSDPGDVESSALSVSWIRERLRRWGADNVVMFLDACRDTGARDGIGIGTEQQPGVITFYACSPNQQSYEIEQLGHGSFTHTLLESLQIQGEGNCATVERLYQRLRYRVREINRKYQKPLQQPYAIAEPATKLHLILLPDYATLADINQLKLDSYQAEVKGDWELARQLWIHVNVTARGSDMEAIEAFPRITRNQTSHQENRSETSQPLTIDGGEFLMVASQQGNRSVVSGVAPTQEVNLQVLHFEVVTVNTQGKQVQKEKRQAKYFTEDLGNNITLEMVTIRGGTFMMGSPEGEGYDYEKSQHEVTVPSFFMGKYPATQAQWKAVAALDRVNRDLKPYPSIFKGDDRPVEMISWYDAVEFCDRLSKYTGKHYRLPSEAEWEYACRAGTTTTFHFGETITTEIANYRGTDWNYEGRLYPGHYGEGPKGKFREQTTDVGSFPPNAFGLYDMHGNVWEWCADHWHENYKGAPKDVSVWVKSDDNDNISQVLRGGSWDSSPENCRSAYRNFYSPGLMFSYLGFRVVCVAVP